MKLPISYSNVFVECCENGDQSWARAKALLGALTLDSRQFIDLEDGDAGLQLLERPRLPRSALDTGPDRYASYRRGSIRFNVAASIHVRIEDANPHHLAEFLDAVRAAMGTREFRAEMRMRQFAALELAREQLRSIEDLASRPSRSFGESYWTRKRRESEQQIATLVWATEQPSDLPRDAAACSRIATEKLDAVWTQVRQEFSVDSSKAGRNTFEEALRRLVEPADESEVFEAAATHEVVRERG